MRRRGFTFAEALVVLVIGGYCILPIMGTLQNSVQQTQRFDHNEKLRTLGRSRLTKCIALCSYKGIGKIDTSTEYHYIYQEDGDENLKTANSDKNPSDYETANPTHQIIYAYKTEVSFESNLKLKNVTGSLPPSYQNLLDGQVGLKAIVVSATWLSDDPNTDITLSQFRLVNLPIPEGDKIYASDPSQCRIVVIDPKLGTIINTFSWPLDAPNKKPENPQNRLCRPGNIAISPNRKYLAIQFEEKLQVLCVEEGNDKFGEFVDKCDFADKLIKLDGDKDFRKRLQENRGVAFRPDGKYVYVTSKEEKKLHILSFNPDTGEVALITSKGLSNKDKFTDIHAGQDGWLYIASKDLEFFIRYQMYPEDITNPLAEKVAHLKTDGNSNKVQAICTSRNGRNVIGLGKDNYLNWYDSEKNEILNKVRLTYRKDKEAADIIIGGDSNYAYVPIKKWKREESSIIGFRLPLDGGANDPSKLNESDPASLVNYAFPGKSATVETILDSSLNKIVVDRDILPEIYLIDEKGIREGTYQNTDNNDDHNLIDPAKYIRFADSDSIELDVNYDDDPNNDVETLANADVSSLATRNPEYTLVSTDNNKIEFIDIYGQFVNDEKTIELTKPAINLAMNAAGSRVSAIIENSSNDHRRKIFDCFSEEANTEITANICTAGSSNVKLSKCVYAFEKGVGNYKEDFVAQIESIAGQGLYISDAPPGGSIDENLANWIPIDIVAMNNNGFLILYKDATGTSRRMLRWWGKYQTKPDDNLSTKQVGDYDLFASWYSNGDNFPPPYSGAIAISANDSLLAFATYPASGDNKVYMYDFNAQNFGHLTQIPGLITDERENEPNLESNIAIDNNTTTAVNYSSSFKGSDGQKITDAFTALNNRPNNVGNFRKEPANFCHDSFSAHKFGDPVRAFGYYYPSENYQTLGIVVRDSCQVFMGKYYKNISWGSGNIDYQATINAPELKLGSSNFFQWNWSLDSGGEANVGLGVLVSPSNINITGMPSIVSGNSRDGHYDNISGWNHIKAKNCRAFKFRPQLLNDFELSGSTTDSVGIVFSRDISRPVLYAMAADAKKIWMQSFGQSPKKILLPTSETYTDKIIAISPDGQRLMIGCDTSGKKAVWILDISMPSTYRFSSDIDRRTTDRDTDTTTAPYGFGDILAKVKVSGNIKSIATRPFVRHKSIANKFELLNGVNLPENMCGNHIAAMADNGIYLTGATKNFSYLIGYKKIFRFNPVVPNDSNKTKELNALLPHPGRHPLVFSYDQQIFVLGGMALDMANLAFRSRYGFAYPGSEIKHSYVQVYDIKTNSFAAEKGNYLSAAARMHFELAGQSTQSSYKEKYICDNNASTQWRSSENANAAGNDVNFDVEFTGPRVKPTKGAVLNPSGEGIKVVDFDYYDGGWTTGHSSVNMSAGQWNSFNTNVSNYFYKFRLDIEADYDNDMHICEYELIGDLMRPVTKDDLSTSIENDVTGGCMTPYGYAWSGGVDNANTNSQESWLYWPHVIRTNSAGNFIGYGLNRELPDLPTNAQRHSMVWHKGHLLLVGSNFGESKALWFNIEKRKWLSLHGDDGKIYLDTTSPRNPTANEPRLIDPGDKLEELDKAVVCSHGDEIFIFGGDDDGDISNIAFAWNPSTGKIRSLTNQFGSVCTHRNLLSAVSCGPYIYLFGGTNTTDEITDAACNKIYRYTP